MMANEPVLGSAKSDAKWYFEQFTGDREEFYAVFFDMCKKYGVTWSKASSQEKQFIEEITRFTFERNKARACGIPVETVLPVFDFA